LILPAQQSLEADQYSVLTPGGTGAITVVRIRGEDVKQWLRKRATRRPLYGRAAFSTIVNDDHEIDDVVIMLAQDGLSADLCLHGGPAVLREVIAHLNDDGFINAEALAGPYDSTGDDLAAHVRKLIPFARTEHALRMILHQPNAWNELERAGNSSDTAAAEADSTLLNMLYAPTVAIIGVPNSGKSTLANRLCGRDVSIVADHVGTTRDWVSATADVNGLLISLVDTPGLRSTHDLAERRAIDLARPVLNYVDLLLVVIDLTGDVNAQWNRLQPIVANRLVVVVLTKRDLIGHAVDPPVFPSGLPVVRVSSFDPHAIDCLRSSIVDALCSNADDTRRARAVPGYKKHEATLPLMRSRGFSPGESLEMT
jgi:small GTP-binding protein